MDSISGHPGIDLISSHGTSIYAVFEGKVVSLEPATDGFEGFTIKITNQLDTSSGEGWIFIIEHITPETNITVNATVSKGQVIGVNAITGSFSNHYELSFGFNNFEFHKNQTCWVDQLEASEKEALESKFKNTISQSANFITSWEEVLMEDKLPFKGLLDTTQFPDGPQLCYPQGTDVRQ